MHTIIYILNINIDTFPSNISLSYIFCGKLLTFVTSISSDAEERGGRKSANDLCNEKNEMQ